jgi:dTMP kinase
MGTLITFEGIDFSGKSVQASLLYERLKSKAVDVLFLREPGGTEISENIRNVLLDNKYDKMQAATEVLLYSAARAQMVAEKVTPHLKSGGVVICDRFYDSTTAYQGYGRQIDLDFIQRLNKFVTQGVKPDLTFLLDLDPEEALKRKDKNGKSLDRLEQEHLKFHQRVRAGYLKIAQAEPNRFKIINGSRSIESIQEEVLAQTISMLKL